MKKFLIIFGLVLGFASASYSAGDICCGEDKEACCAAYGRVYCPDENVYRTRCRNVTPPACIGGDVSILMGSVVYGVRQQRYVQKWGNAKKS